MTLAEGSEPVDNADPGESAPRRRIGGVAIAYLALICVLAGVIGWIAIQDGETAGQSAGAAQQVEVSIERVAPTPSARSLDLPPPTAPPPPVIEAAPQPPPAIERDGTVVLTPAPVAGLVEDTRSGPLPRIAEDGRQPWQVYSRPFAASDSRPRVSILISELGLSSEATAAAIQRLPGTVSLAFVPYAERLPSWIEQARAGGHEVLLTIPMEPLTYPRDDPGPKTLLTSLSDGDNLERLEWSMSRVAGYVGMVSFMGSRFTTNPLALRPVLTALKTRGLLYVESLPRANGASEAIARNLALPHVVADRIIDDLATQAAIDEQLAGLEGLARKKGTAVGIASPYPITLDRVAQWAPTLAAKGLALAPISAAVRRP